MENTIILYSVDGYPNSIFLRFGANKGSIQEISATD
jgi:hypothetical protein